MATESNDDHQREWLGRIKEQVKQKLGANKWRDSHWNTEFVKEVALWLHEDQRDDDDVVDTAAGLIKYGIKKKEDLSNVADNKKEFRDTLESKGVLPAICDLLFSKLPPPQQDGHDRRPPLHPASPTLTDVIMEIRSMKAGATPNLTPASFGSKEIERLSNANLITKYKGVAGQASVLKESEVKLLGEMTTEHHVVTFLTPYLEDVFEGMGGYSIVNSEEYPWLQTSENTKYNQKPDLLLCHDSTYTKKAPFSTKDEHLRKMRRQADKFGILSDWRLRKCIGATFEATVKIDNQAFGEVINYGAHICFDGGPVHTRLILFDISHFWLIECTSGTVSYVTKCDWTTPGSRSLLSGFQLKDKLMELLKCACENFRVEARPDAFLGAGAFGFVFQVYQLGREKPMALKLVLCGEESDDEVRDLESEMISMQKAKALCRESVMGVVEDGFNTFDGFGGALLLSDVGAAVPKKRYKDLILSLVGLHEQDIIHGDPRVQNAVLVDDSLCWIDFRNARLSMHSAMKKQADMETLLKSLGVLPGDSKEYVKAYDGTRARADVIVSLLSDER